MVKWPDLLVELDRWEAAGKVATLWWRDDDAVAPTPRLDRLLSIAPAVPLSLAVIPMGAERELAGWLGCCPRPAPNASVHVLQHGWRHLNHARVGKKSEFTVDRLSAEVTFDLAAGRERLDALFGTRALPVLVPPWNRFDSSFLALLPHCDLTAISRVGPRSADPLSGVNEVNIHVDLVAWKGSRGFVGEEAALRGLVEHLKARRLRTACADEPTGILTHHLLQDEATEAFLDRLIAVTRAHPAARWLNAAEVFAPASAASA
jgi:hypothetical protein